MRLRDHEMPLDPDVERELEAVDHALQGLRVATDLEELRDLAVDARADRPALEPDFGTKLDQWAAAGFPREGRPAARASEETGSAVSGLFERLRSVPPRRLLLSMGAAATFVVAVGVGIGVSDQLGGSGGGGAGSTALTAPSSAGGPATGSEPNASARGAPIGAPSVQDELNVQPGEDSRSARFGQLRPAVPAGAPSVAGLLDRAAHRKVEQNVDLVLATEPQDVRDVADRVFGVADEQNGFVVSSNITSGRGSVPVPGGPADAREQSGGGAIQRRVPAAHLPAAVGGLSQLPPL